MALLISPFNFYNELYFIYIALFHIELSSISRRQPNSKDVHMDIKSFQDLVKTKDGILAIHDMEEYPN